MPPFMIIQTPHYNRNEKKIKRIFINPELDLSSVLCNISHKCEVCQNPADRFCKHCSCSTFGFHRVMIHLCSRCSDTIHKNHSRSYHDIQLLNNAEIRHPNLHRRVSRENFDTLSDRRVQILENPSRYTLELFAVVSIKISHYVAFVKCGEEQEADWVFFDSMAGKKSKAFFFSEEEKFLNKGEFTLDKIF